MPDPITMIGLGSSLLGGIAKVATGIGQSSSQPPQMPQFEQPEEVDTLKQIGLNEAHRTRIPGQSAIEESFRSTTASNIDALKETAPGGNVGGINQVYQGERGAFRDLAVQSAMERQEGLKMLTDALRLGVDMDMTEYETNKLYPYRTQLQDHYNKQFAGGQNAFGGFSDISSNLLGYSAMRQNNDLLEAIYGPKKMGEGDSQGSPPMVGDPEMYQFPMG